MKALSVQNLTKIYKNGHKALKGISLDVDAGDFFGLLGPNGAGKTTLIGIITSLVNKTSGKVFIFDNDIDTDFETAKSFIGVVPQEFNFNVFDTVEQITLNQAGFYGIPLHLAQQRSERYLKQLNLWEKRSQPARTLSGGMKRRLMIARALIHEPKLLILDEPTAGVDVELRRTTWDFLRTLNQQGITIILTTHYLEEAETLCNNLAIIDHGKIIEKFSMNELLHKLQTETFLLYLNKALDQLPIIKNFHVRLINPTVLEVDVSNVQTLNELFLILSDLGIEVNRMKNKVGRLEELFFKLTTEQHESQ